MTSSVIVFELANGFAVFFAYTNHIRRNFQEDHVQHDDHIDLIDHLVIFWCSLAILVINYQAGKGEWKY